MSALPGIAFDTQAAVRAGEQVLKELMQETRTDAATPTPTQFPTTPNSERQVEVIGSRELGVVGSWTWSWELTQRM